MKIHETNLLFAILVLFCVTNWSGRDAIGQENTEWLVGGKLTQAAQSLAVSVNWEGAPLRERLENLSQRQRVSIFLDRRVDGSQELDFSVNNVSLEECLWRICEQLELGCCRIDDIYYVGPREAAGSLGHQVAALKKTVDAADRARRLRWERAATLSIPRLAQPRELIQTTCTSVGASLPNKDDIPHDLWAPAQLPASEAATRLSLLLVGFGKSFELDEDLTQLSLIDLPNSGEVTRIFQLGKNAKAGASLIEAEMPEVAIIKRARSLQVTTTPDKSLQVHRMLVALQKPGVAELSKQVFTLKTASQRGNVLATIAKQIDREFSFDQEHVEILNQRVEIDLKDAPVEEVIAAALAGSELEYRISSGKLEILGGSAGDGNE